MAHNAFIHGGTGSPTAWVPGYEVLQLDFQTIDQLLFESINGDQGGAWAPIDTIVIGGAGVELDTTGNTFLVTGTGSANFFGGALIFQAASAIFYGGVATFTGTTATFAPGNVIFGVATVVTFNNGFNVATGDAVVTTGNIDVVAGQVHVAGNVQFDANLSVAGISTIDTIVGSSVSLQAAAIVLNGSGIVNTLPLVQSGAFATAQFDAAVTFASTANIALASIITPSGVGRQRIRPAVTVTDSNYTFAIGDGDTFLIPALGANRTGTVSSTGAAEGDRMHLNAYANTTANTMSILGGISYLANNTGCTIFLDLLFTGGSWIVDNYLPF